MSTIEVRAATLALEHLISNDPCALARTEDLLRVLSSDELTRLVPNLRVLVRLAEAAQRVDLLARLDDPEEMGT